MAPTVASTTTSAPPVMEPHQQPELRQEDFPNVKFWHKHEWIGHSKKEKGITALGKGAGQHEDSHEDNNNGDNDEVKGQSNRGDGEAKNRTM